MKSAPVATGGVATRSTPSVKVSRTAPGTPPELVHEFVSDLYRLEIRRLRDRLLAGEFPRREYAGRVIELRLRYRIISMRPHEWIESP